MYKTITLFIQKQTEADESLNRLRILFRTLAISLGIMHVYAAIKSQSMNADGISYLDIGDAYFRGDWMNAINPVWSPLYSWLLGLTNLIIHPSMEWEFPVVHMVNLLIYVGALASFEFMWKTTRWSHESVRETKILRMPDWLWWMLGYLLFIWISLSLIQIWSVTPDMLMASFIFIAAGLVARIRAGDEKSRNFVFLGFVLGLGYLSKTFMFSTALVFLIILIIVIRRTAKNVSNVFLAAGVFLLISLPFILLISEKKGKFTIGEAGIVTYLRYVNGIPFPHWQGDPLEGIIPIHPSRIVHQSPTVYEFGEPIGGTYPISTDPSYWFEGVDPRFDLVGLPTRLFASGLVYAEVFLQKQGIFLACVLALYVMGQTKKYSFFQILQRWVLVIPAIVAFGLYAIVLVESRYIGAFVLLFWVDILANICLPDRMNERAWLKVLGVIGAIGLLANIIMFNLDGFRRLNTSLDVSSVEQAAPRAKPLEVAQALNDLGIRPGDKVGVIGYAFDSFWARLADVKIVAEMLDTDASDFWRGDDVLRQSVLQAFARTGANAVVAEYVPDDAQMADWHRIDQSNYYIFWFDE